MASDCCRWTVRRFCETNDWPSPINIDIGGGFRRDKFKWSIAGPNKTPDVLSKLEWRDLRIALVEGSASYVSCRNYAIQVSADYGHIYHGKNIDSDFLSDDEEDLFSRSISKAGKGHVYDVSGAVGYRVTSTCGRFVATPLLGYSHHAQYLHIYDGHQVFDLFDGLLGPIPGLNSRYIAHWFGPWVGITFAARVESCAYVFGSFDWHFFLYRAKGHWNLRPDISSFHHESTAHGWTATLGGNWEIWNNWSIGIVVTYRDFISSDGDEKLTVFDPILGPIRVRTRFNGARLFSGAVSGIIAWRF